MTLHKLLRTGCGTALGILAIYRYKSQTSPVGAAQVEKEPWYIPNTDVGEDRQECCPVKSEREWDCNWDKMAKQKPGARKHIVLIRHGHFSAPPSEPEKQSLTKLGREQATLVGQRLTELCCPYVSITYSTMPRAKETAEIIASYFPDVPVSANNILMEGAPLPAEPAVTGLTNDPVKHYADGPRFEAAFRQLFYRSTNDECEESVHIVVSHANVIRYFVCRALQFPPEGYLRLSLPHCSITWLTIVGDGRVVMKCFGESSFMPPDTITATTCGL